MDIGKLYVGLAKSPPSKLPLTSRYGRGTLERTHPSMATFAEQLGISLVRILMAAAVRIQPVRGQQAQVIVPSPCDFAWPRSRAMRNTKPQKIHFQAPYSNRDDLCQNHLQSFAHTHTHISDSHTKHIGYPSSTRWPQTSPDDAPGAHRTVKIGQK